MFPPATSTGSVPVNDSTDREFEDILNQLNALGSEIEQEISSKYKSKESPSSPKKESEGQSFESPYHHHQYQRSEMLLTNGSQNGTYYSEEPPPPPELTSSANGVVQNGGDESKPYYAPHLYHHHHAHHHHLPSLQHHHYHHYSDSGQSLDSSTTGENALPVLEMSSQLSQLRTDSPDNDSAFSDSISLISSEQSSSSSSSNSNKAPNMNSNCNLTSSNNSKPPQAPSPVSNSSSQVIVSASGSESTTPVKQQQLFLESSSIDSDNKDDSLGSLHLMNLNESTPKVFAQIDQILNGIDWNFFDEITIKSQETDLIPKLEKEATEKKEKSPTEESNSKPKLESSDTSQKAKNEEKVETEIEFGEKIREAMAKIREANIRKLYLKVFAEDNSAKSLLADERMTIGAICRQLAAKNYIQMGLDHCIIEHMPQLYLERFYEDHESLVENVLYWGRDHTNKLYFMPRVDKYDLFIQPEKYLISVSQPNDNADTLKSGSLRAKYNANQLRSDLIAQFFSTGTTVRVPEIEGNLYLRTDGKKSWKKYFFSLRASGLYYCPKGKPKSTKDLICLTTFELNCLYYGFGWKKKFKAPTEFGFAVKHPQIQAKSPKHIKYLCAESEEDFRLWMTGIRIAKYGRQLMENFEQFKLADNGEADCEETHKNSESKKTTTFQPSNSDLSNGTNGFGYFEGETSSHYQHSSILMRHTPRNESVRSSSASSSSGCMSEQSSVVSSTPSNPDSTSSNSNYHFTSPMHHPMTHHHLQQSPLAFEADFPMGTIKRKPNVMLQPKIPLTNTTRNLALQSDDALLEVSDGSGGSCGASGDEANYSGSSPSPDQFQRGTFKTGTLRRSSNTDERSIKSPSKISIMQSPQHQVYLKTEEEEELPPPPPPVLKPAESTTSLNASFPPPPPPEVLDQQSNQSNSISEPNTPLKQAPPQLSALPMPPMTPQPQPKFASFNHRLSRRLSDLSDNLPYLANFRSQYQEGYLVPNSRASIATASDSNTSFVSLKLNPKINRFQNRHMTLDHHQQQNGHAQLWNKFGTSPRLRNFEPNCEVAPPPTPNSMYHPKSSNNMNGTYGSSHCAIVADSNSNYNINGQAMGRPDYDLLPNTGRVKVFAPYQPASAPPSSMPPPPPESNHYQSQQPQPRESHYMSISPHLLQKHQQMMQRQQQQQPYSNGSIYNGSQNYQVPEEMFIKNMERVMQKKWNVAQMLQKDTSATPGQVLGFRDSAYLPPPPSTSQSMDPSSQQMAFPPPPPSSLTSPYPQVYPNYPNSPYAAYNGSSQPNSPFHNGYHHQKQVRIAEEPQVHYAPGSTCSTSSNSSLKRIPPPPPKRSDTTQLTLSSSRLS